MEGTPKEDAARPRGAPRSRRLWPGLRDPRDRLDFGGAEPIHAAATPARAT